MAKYGNFIYGTQPYGISPRLAYSVEPMTTTVINFTEVYVTWQMPTGTFSKLRLVRNQVGFPETEEDGVTVWQQSSSDGSSLEGLITTNIFRDGEDTPLPGVMAVNPGSEVFYTMFIFNSAKVWLVAGKTSGLIPSNHSSQQKMMEIIPKVFTTKEQSPLGVVDPTSALYAFLGGVSFTYEQILTSLKLLQPSLSWSSYPSSMIGAQAYDLGLNYELGLPVTNQKMLIREAPYMYSHKGLVTGINTYVESLTGYAPTTTSSTNLLLSVQDSTFYGTTGNWIPTNATISSSTTVVPPTNAKQIDTTQTCKIIASASGSMVLGLADPIRTGVPVLPSTQYTTSLQLNSPASAGNITLSIQFYNMFGVATSAIHNSTPVAATNTWAAASVTATTDATSNYAVLTVAYSAAGTYYVDQVCVQLGASVVYDEARAVSVTLAPTKTNLIYNPSFEVDLTNWTATGGPTITQDTSSTPVDAYSGTHCMKIVSAGAFTLTSNKALASTFGITVDKYYTGSIYLKNSAALTLRVAAQNASNVDIASATLSIPINTVWTRYQLPLLLDESLTTLNQIYLELDSAVANTVYLDCVQLEFGQKATDYFDGSLPTAFGAIWAGTAHASATYQYINKLIKIPRLGATLGDWIPSNLFWRINTLVATEYTNLS